MTNANDAQIGGTHYRRSTLQHWDFCFDVSLLYGTFQITRYLVRWKNKSGVEDVKKMAHYAQKMREVAERNTHTHLRRMPLFELPWSELANTYNITDDNELMILELSCSWWVLPHPLQKLRELEIYIEALEEFAAQVENTKQDAKAFILSAAERYERERKLQGFCCCNTGQRMCLETGRTHFRCPVHGPMGADGFELVDTSEPQPYGYVNQD